MYCVVWFLFLGVFGVDSEVEFLKADVAKAVQQMKAELQTIGEEVSDGLPGLASANAPRSRAPLSPSQFRALAETAAAQSNEGFTVTDVSNSGWYAWKNADSLRTNSGFPVWAIILIILSACGCLLCCLLLCLGATAATGWVGKNFISWM